MNPFTRNVDYIKENGPKFLTKLGFKVIGHDRFFWNLRGGTVSFLVREKLNPRILYCVWVDSWFKELQLDTMFPITESEQHIVEYKGK